MTTSAFIKSDVDSNKYLLQFYNNPKRWKKYSVPKDCPLQNIENWSMEYKYFVKQDRRNILNPEIRQIPNDSGGVYIFYVKGITLPFMENYILYVGRCHYSEGQNIRKRAKEYDKDLRGTIMAMKKLWGDYLYYRFYPECDEEIIDKYEELLIKAIVPYYNELIPDKYYIKKTVPAF